VPILHGSYNSGESLVSETWPAEWRFVNFAPLAPLVKEPSPEDKTERVRHLTLHAAELILALAAFCVEAADENSGMSPSTNVG